MRWLKTRDLRSSIYAMFSVSTAVAPKPKLEDVVTMDQIRQAMLSLTAHDQSERAAGLCRRIRYATDLQALWFMRGELMHLLARSHGEMEARQRVDEVSSLFIDLLPTGLRSRPSPLAQPYRASRPHSDET